MFDLYYDKQEDYTSELRRWIETTPDQLAQIEVFSKYYGGYNWSVFAQRIIFKYTLGSACFVAKHFLIELFS